MHKLMVECQIKIFQVRKTIPAWNLDCIRILLVEGMGMATFDDRRALRHRLHDLIRLDNTLNARHEITGVWGGEMDAVHAKARALWADALKGTACEGGTDDEREIFATALYHGLIDPRSVSDVDGWYVGADNQKHRADGFVYRTIFSGWDVFRSQFPLLTLVRPDVVNDEINSLLQLAKLSGRNYLERWEILNSYSGCMVGNPAVSVVVDAYEKGIRGYDVEEAYRQCKNSVEKFGNGKRGFTPGDLSTTLEYAYSDWCMGRFAQSLKREADASQ